jgi:hypothetical protein
MMLRLNAVPRLLQAALTVDPRSLAALRIGLAAIMLMDVITRVSDFSALYTDTGILPLEALEEPLLPFALYRLSGMLPVQAALLGVQACVAVLLLLGWRTRLATGAAWLLVASLQRRNPLVLFGGDMVLQVLLFWSLFLPLGRVWSLDARRSKAAAAPRPILSAAGIALLGQVAIIYVFAGVNKSASDWAVGGNAIYYTLFQEGWVRPLGLLLRESPALCAFMTPLVRYTEIWIPLLLFAPWPRLRCLGVGMTMAFQAGLGLTYILAFFPWVNSVAVLAFVPGALWDRLGARPTTVGTPARPAGARARAGEAVLALAFIYVVIFNVVDGYRSPMLPRALTFVAERAGLNQSWGMYSPGVDRFDVWHVARGQLADGRTLDLFRPDEPLADSKPALTGPRLHAFRYAHLIESLRGFGEHVQRRLAHMFCRDWNREQGGPDRLESLELVFVRQYTPAPGGEPYEPEPYVLLRHRCSERGGVP